MSRKDYAAIAAVLHSELFHNAETGREADVIMRIAEGLALQFKAANAAFDRGRFMQAVREGL